MSEHEVTVRGLKPRSLAHIQNVTLPTANFQWLSRNLHPKHTPCGIRVMVAVTVPGVFSAIITRKGDTQVVDMNEGDPLVPEALYRFEFMVHHHDRINFSYDTTSGMIKILRVEEIDASIAVGNTETSG